MINLNKKLIKIKNSPYVIFKVENFFDDNFYQDIKKLFNDIDTNQLSITENFGKKSVEPLQSNFKNKDHKLILSRLNDIIFSKSFFNYFVKRLYFPIVISQNNFLKKIRYLRYPILNNEKKKFDFLFSKISVKYAFSLIKNGGGISPHVDAQRKYISLMLYFPDDDEKDIEYGTTFWNSDIPNSSNERLKDDIKYSEFKKQNKVLFKTPFVSNCLYGFIRNDFSWHTVEPLEISKNYVRKSININFLYENF